LKLKALSEALQELLQVIVTGGCCLFWKKKRTMQ